MWAVGARVNTHIRAALFLAGQFNGENLQGRVDAYQSSGCLDWMKPVFAFDKAAMAPASSTAFPARKASFCDPQVLAIFGNLPELGAQIGRSR